MAEEPRIKDKQWSREMEAPIVAEFRKSKLYSFDAKTKKPVFSIDTPPPYVNTPVHIGQTTTYVLMDMFARFRRMTGHNVIFPLGLDRNGLPIEVAAEKKFNVRLTQTPREKFLEMCKSVLEEASAESIDTFARCGIAFSSWEFGEKIGDGYYTDSTSYRALTQSIFLDLWERGLVYEDEKVVNFCPGCQTTIADSEIDYKESNTLFNDVKFKVKETGEEIVIGTTRPELMATCAMVIFNPDDARYKHLEGKHAITPIFEKPVPIRAHPQADPRKGTGLVMMCAFGDLADIRFFREMKLKPTIAIQKDGRMNERAGILAGLKVKEARAKLLDEFKTRGLLVNQRQVSNRTPICERSKDPIEFIEMKEFYLKQMDFLPELRKTADKIEFFAPQSKQILIDWINSVSTDWPISRRRYYATEVPLWYCQKCNEVIVPPKGKYYQPWHEASPVKKCKCGSTEFRGEERVFDTWFDSSNSALYILGYGRDDEFFKKNYPCSVRPQGKEIVRTWLYYTLLKGQLLTKKPAFKDVWINYHIVDDKGEKMSKSKGNTISPKEALEKFGAEPFRLWAAVEGNLTGTDFRCSFDRIEGAGKTIVKLWNVARFISQFEPPAEKPKLAALDEWILTELNALVKQTREGYESYDFHNPAISQRHFLWETFASHYLELVKPRAYNQDGVFTKEEQDAARWTLNHVVHVLLKLMAPIVPLITYKLHKELVGNDVHAEEFPEPLKGVKVPEFTTTQIVELNSAIWKHKKDKGLSLKTPLESAVLPKILQSVEKDLQRAHGIQKLEWSSSLQL